MRLPFAIAAALVPVTLAIPNQPPLPPHPHPNPPSCKEVDFLVTKLHVAAGASRYCSSVLHITPDTVHVSTTITPAVSTITTGTGTDATTTVISTETDTSTSTETSTTTDYSQVTCTPSQGVNKREAAPTPLAYLNVPREPAKAAVNCKTSSTKTTSTPATTPTCIKGQPSHVVSSACACLDLPTPSTTTITATATAAASTTTVTTTSTGTVTSLTTTTTTTTTTTATTSTVQATETILFGETSQYTASDGFTLFNEYPGTDFYGFDIPGCECYDGSGVDDCYVDGNFYNCQSYNDCMDVCAAVSDARGYMYCKGVSYTPQGEEGGAVNPFCFPKYAVPGNGAPGCGVYQTTYNVDSANVELQGYPYPINSD